MNNEGKKPNIRTLLFAGYGVNIFISSILMILFVDLSYLIDLYRIPTIQNLLIYAVFAGILVLFLYLLIKFGGLTFKGEDEAGELMREYRSEKMFFPHLSLSALSEEMLYRAALIGLLSLFFNIYIAAGLSLFLFLLAHVKQYKYDLKTMFALLLLGGFTTWAFVINPVIWGPVIIHMIYNFMVVRWLGNISVENTSHATDEPMGH